MTPCYYCELDREHDCKRCIHDSNGDEYVTTLENGKRELLLALKRAERETWFMNCQELILVIAKYEEHQ